MLQIEFSKVSGTLIKDQQRQWVSLAKEAQSFGDYFKVEEFVNPKNPPGQINITIMMNSHERRFQASIVMIEIQIIHL